MGRLRAYGNTLNAPQAQNFIAACMHALTLDTPKTIPPSDVIITPLAQEVTSLSYQEIKYLRRQIERHINRAMHHLQADHSAAAYCEFQNTFGILAELIATLDKKNPL